MTRLLAAIAICFSLVGVAFADAVPVPSADSLTLVETLWKSGAVLPALIVAAYLLLSIASRYIPWLEQGKRAAYTAAALTFLTALVGTAASGTTPNSSMLMTALFTAIAMVMHPTQQKQGS